MIFFVGEVTSAQFTISELEFDANTVSRISDVSVTWMGVTNLIFSDSETNLIVDGFFTRVPSDADHLANGVFEPNYSVIESSLKELGIEKAAAIMVVHSHFDHSLDAPVVAKLTNAMLLGSESTANIGRGMGLSEEQIHIVETGKPLRFGNFSITFFKSKHWRLPNSEFIELSSLKINTPLTPPAHYSAYKMGEVFSIYIQHPSVTFLIHASAGFIENSLSDVNADLVMLGTGGLGDLPEAEQENYFREVVINTGASWVFPIHWDYMWTKPGEPLKPDNDFQRAMQFLQNKYHETGIRFALLPYAKSVFLPIE